MQLCILHINDTKVCTNIFKQISRGNAETLVHEAPESPLFQVHIYRFIDIDVKYVKVQIFSGYRCHPVDQRSPLLHSLLHPPGQQ